MFMMSPETSGGGKEGQGAFAPGSTVKGVAFRGAKKD